MGIRFLFEMMDSTRKVQVSSNGCRMPAGPNNNFQKTQMVHGVGSDFIGSWVKIGMPAKKKTLSVLGHKSFEEQCSFCEQVPLNYYTSKTIYIVILQNICLLPPVGNYKAPQQMVNGYLYRLHLHPLQPVSVFPLPAMRLLCQFAWQFAWQFAIYSTFSCIITRKYLGLIFQPLFVTLAGSSQCIVG